MIEVFQAAVELQNICLREKWKFCFIGGLALQRWGEPRFTKDADLTLYTGLGGEECYIEILLRHFPARIVDAAEFALRHRVLLLQSSKGVGIDVALGGLEFEATVVKRASYFLFPPDLNLLTCSAEDLVVMKSFAERGQDWVDVERILVRQAGKLDWPYILRQLKPLADLKESPQILNRLKKLRSESES
ncbi:MAG: hypothetical protein M3Y82_04375 [Verrucomicrobiota bacterium]|nr:hypothetical protein [Verrucomicrobiota bacterium]